MNYIKKYSSFYKSFESIKRMRTKVTKVFLDIIDTDEYYTVNTNSLENVNFKNTVNYKHDNKFSKHEISRLKKLNKFKIITPTNINYYKFGTDYLKLYSNSFDVGNLNLDIKKIEDDWFIVRIDIEYDKIISFNTTYFKCDQINGLINLLNKFNFKKEESEINY